MERTKLFALVIVVTLVLGVGIFFLVYNYGLETAESNYPTLDFLPKPDQEKNPKSTLIWVNRQAEKNESFWANQLENYIKEYRDSTRGQANHCVPQNDKSVTEDEFCFVDVDKMKGCISTKQDQFGYTNGITKPCVLLKLNKIVGWKPKPYTEADLDIAASRNMPKDLRDRIRALNQSSDLVSQRTLDTIWISCEGENAVDSENLGPITFYVPGRNEPFPGIPGYYFPFQNQNGYQTPFVFVRFENPQVNVLIQVECKAWALNIENDREQRIGVTHFELMVD